MSHTQDNQKSLMLRAVADFCVLNQRVVRAYNTVLYALKHTDEEEMTPDHFLRQLKRMHHLMEEMRSETERIGKVILRDAEPTQFTDSTTHQGHGPPSIGMGQPGDYYEDLDTQILYGPKKEGDVWPDTTIKLRLTSS